MGGGRYWEGVDVLARADWVVSWGLGVAAWRLGCMTSFSCLLLLGRDVPSRWHFTGILEHINNSHFSYLQQVALRFVPSMTVSWRLAEKSDGGIGGKGGDGVAVQGRESDGQRRLDVATRSVSAPDRLRWWRRCRRFSPGKALHGIAHRRAWAAVHRHPEQQGRAWRRVAVPLTTAVQPLKKGSAFGLAARPRGASVGN